MMTRPAIATAPGGSHAHLAREISLLGLVATAFGFGFRHGIDWDHIAAITDITSSQESPRCSMFFATLYAAGHAVVVFGLGLAAIVLAANLPSSLEHIRSGKLRALAVTTAARSEALSDVSTVGEFVPGYEASAFFGINAPKATPPEIIERLNKEINAILAEPGAKARFANLGGTVLPGSPANFGKLVADETEKWAKVIKFANIKPE